MSGRISLQEFLSGMTARSGLKKAEVQQFLKVLSQVLEDGLSRDGIVKISGLGQFKLVWNEPRKSVNVQTGETMEIAGHNKLVFTPDTTLKEHINAPLSHLEVVDLDINTMASDGEVGREKSVPLKKLSEQASELSLILESLKDKSDDVVCEDGTHLEEKKKRQEGPVDVSFAVESAKAASEESKIETAESKTVSDPPRMFPTSKLSGEDFVKSREKLPARGHRALGWIIFGVCIVVLLVIGGLFVYERYDETLELTNVTVSTIEEELPLFSEEDAVMVSDSIVNEPIGSESTILSPFERERVYTQYLDTVKMANGNRLTLLSLKYYGHRNYWVYIYEANRDRIKHPNKIEVGAILYIPLVDSVLIDPSNERSLEYAQGLKELYVAQ